MHVPGKCPRESVGNYDAKWHYHFHHFCSTSLNLNVYTTLHVCVIKRKQFERSLKKLANTPSSPPPHNGHVSG